MKKFFALTALSAAFAVLCSGCACWDAVFEQDRHRAHDVKKYHGGSVSPRPGTGRNKTPDRKNPPAPVSPQKPSGGRDNGRKVSAPEKKNSGYHGSERLLIPYKDREKEKRPGTIVSGLSPREQELYREKTQTGASGRSPGSDFSERSRKNSEWVFGR